MAAASWEERTARSSCEGLWAVAKAEQGASATSSPQRSFSDYPNPESLSSGQVGLDPLHRKGAQQETPQISFFATKEGSLGKPVGTLGEAANKVLGISNGGGPAAH